MSFLPSSRLRRSRWLATALSLALFAAASQSSAQTAAEEAALRFVTTYKIGNNLPTMALATASQTQTFSMLSAKVGAAAARDLIRTEIMALVPQYQDQWNQTLAAAYAKHFSTEELVSLASEGPRSQYASKLPAMQQVVGDDMRTASQPMLTELLTEVLTNAIGKAQ